MTQQTSNSDPQQFLLSNPLAEHNSGVALSSNQIPLGGTGNMYHGQGGRAFVQGGGGSSQFHSFNAGQPGEEYARGSYAPIAVGHNANASSTFSSSSSLSGGSRKKRSKRSKRGTRVKRNKCKCDLITFGGSRRRRSHRSGCKCKHVCIRCKKYIKRKSNKNKRLFQQNGGSGSGGNGEMTVGWGSPYGSSTSGEANAGYSIGGSVSRDLTALANPAQPTAYNSCHPVA